MKYILSIFILILAGLTFSADTKAAGYTEVDSAKVQELQADGAKLIDSRGGRWFEGKVIKGAKLLAVGDTTAENLASVAGSKETPLVFYCTNNYCPASKFAAKKAIKAGYTNVYKYPGGIEDWASQGLETETIAAE